MLWKEEQELILLKGAQGARGTGRWAQHHEGGLTASLPGEDQAPNSQFLNK